MARTGGSLGAASVNYATSNGTATAGADYTATSSTLNWASGEAGNKTFTIPLTNDTLYEASETVILTMGAPTNASLGTTTVHTVTIINTDAMVTGDYKTEISDPSSSAALGWTYFKTASAFSAGTYNGTGLTSLDGKWNDTSKLYYDYATAPYILVYGAASAIPGRVLPGDANIAVVARWTADVSADSITVTGSVKRNNSVPAEYGDSYLYVSINGGTPTLLASSVSTDTTLKTFSPTLATPIAIGATVDLIVYSSTHNWAGDVALDAQFTMTPP